MVKYKKINVKVLFPIFINLEKVSFGRRLNTKYFKLNTKKAA